MSDTDTPRRATVPPPPRAQRRGILAPVPDVQVTPPPDNMQKANSGHHDMNFKVDPELHTAFKTVASIKGMAMKDLLEASFQCWMDHNADDALRSVIKFTKR